MRGEAQDRWRLLSGLHCVGEVFCEAETLGEVGRMDRGDPRWSVYQKKRESCLAAGVKEEQEQKQRQEEKKSQELSSP